MSFLNSLFNAFGNSDEHDYSDGFNCPICGSKAYWQDDEYKTCWVCSACGYEIIGNQIEFDSNGKGSVLDIDWYCDGCNCHMNYQPGFNAYDSNWKCTECGYNNVLSKDNIL